jgi:hypothetical protein
VPRKKISLPREFLDGVYKKLPSFDIGPLFTAPQKGGQRPILPVPEVHGTEPAKDIPPLPEEGVLPTGPVAIAEGWINLTPV